MLATRTRRGHAEGSESSQNEHTRHVRAHSVAAMDASRAPAHATDAIDGRRALGRLGEDLAARHLEALGFAILARNVRTRHGEIDMIAFGARTLVFVEVKTRRISARRGHALDPDPLAGLAVGQRMRLRRLAAAWLASAEARPSASTIRFDAIGVIVDRCDRLQRLDHLEDAW